MGQSQSVLRPLIASNLVLHNVSFVYPPDTTVLKNLSMKVTEGECVALEAWHSWMRQIDGGSFTAEIVQAHFWKHLHQQT